MEYRFQFVKLDFYYYGSCVFSHGIKFEKSMLLNLTLCFSRKFRAIPRFCDFVTGTSQELFELFLDLKKMFFETGYILQQCALANNTDHFKMVLESVSCSEEDLLYVDPETGGLFCPIQYSHHWSNISPSIIHQ